MYHETERDCTDCGRETTHGVRWQTLPTTWRRETCLGCGTRRLA